MCSSEIFENLEQSSDIFGECPEMIFPAFGQLLGESVRKSSEIPYLCAPMYNLHSVLNQKQQSDLNSQPGVITLSAIH